MTDNNNIKPPEPVGHCMYVAEGAWPETTSTSIEPAPNAALPGGNEIFFSDGPMVRLHRECETPYRHLLEEGQGPQGSPADALPRPHPSGSRAPPSRMAVCVCCYRDEPEEVLIVGPEPGSKTETLHEKCAAEWSAALRNFDIDDDDRADRMSALQEDTKR